MRLGVDLLGAFEPLNFSELSGFWSTRICKSCYCIRSADRRPLPLHSIL